MTQHQLNTLLFILLLILSLLFPSAGQGQGVPQAQPTQAAKVEQKKSLTEKEKRDLLTLALKTESKRNQIQQIRAEYMRMAEQHISKLQAEIDQLQQSQSAILAPLADILKTHKLDDDLNPVPKESTSPPANLP